MDPNTVCLDDISVPRTRIPDELVVMDSIGKGTNNRVHTATWHGDPCVLRAPRRRSDTQQRGSAIWELRHCLHASDIGVGPKVYAAWYARHATQEWPSGLYVVMERFDDDLETLLLDTDLTEHRDAIQTSLVHCLSTLARERILVFDLKPSNIVVRITDGDHVDVRMIDFGRDFCEWTGCVADPTRNTPHIDMLSRTLADHPDAEELTTHLLFATMMVILSSTTTRVLHETRGEHRMDSHRRSMVHPIANATCELLDSMQGRNVQILRTVLRMDEIRGVLAHYHGRRNAGTRRTLAFARGIECV